MLNRGLEILQQLINLSIYESKQFGYQIISLVDEKSNKQEIDNNMNTWEI